MSLVIKLSRLHRRFTNWAVLITINDTELWKSTDVNDRVDGPQCTKFVQIFMNST